MANELIQKSRNRYGYLANLAIEEVNRNFLFVLRCFTEEWTTSNPDWKDRRGGCYCLMNAKTGKILLTAYVGDPPPEKMDKYARLAKEKARRLFAHPKHKTSWESRNDKKRQYPGAVRGKKYIHSFSGLIPDGDTLISALNAQGFETLKDGSARSFIHKDNTGALKLFDAFKKFMDEIWGM